MEWVFFEWEKDAEKEIIEYLELTNSGMGDTNAFKKMEKLKKAIVRKVSPAYRNLTAWNRVQISRHPNRPYTLDYINALSYGNFIEIKGDRCYGDDPAIVAGICKIEGQTFFFVGNQKGRNFKERQMRNFGMAHPEGYRKALRLFRMAEYFRKPIITFIDTPGAYPGIGAEERGQAEAIARNIYEVMQLSVPIITVVIGEGGSGGALATGMGDVILMLENTWFSVISPEACSAILWRDPEHKEIAAEQLKLTAFDLKNMGIIDEVIEETPPGAHIFPDDVYKKVKAKILAYWKKLGKLPEDELKRLRYEKYRRIGVFQTQPKAKVL